MTDMLAGFFFGVAVTTAVVTAVHFWIWILCRGDEQAEKHREEIAALSQKLAVSDDGEADNAWRLRLDGGWFLRQECGGFTITDNKGAVRGHYQNATAMGVCFSVAMQELAALRQQLADAEANARSPSQTWLLAENQRLRQQLAHEMAEIERMREQRARTQRMGQDR